MKQLATSFVLALLLVSCATGSKNGVGTDFELRQYSEETLENGMQVVLIPDNSLPSFSVGMLLKVGYAHDPTAKNGLTSFVNGLLSKGTKKRSANELAAELEQLGSDLQIDTGADYTWLQAGTLSYYGPKLLNLVAEVVTQQRFAKNEVTRLRRQRLALIKKRVDDPDGFADYAFNQYLMIGHNYSGSVYGTNSGVRAIRRKDIIKHYFRFYRPNNAVLFITGKYPKDIMTNVKTTFAKWRKGRVPEIEFGKVAAFEGINIEVVDKKDLVQSQIRFGHLGIKRSNPDYLKLRVANTVLGSGFGSRLLDRVRVKLGLTYSIYSYFNAKGDKGPFLVSTFTKNKTTGKMVEEVIKVIAEFKAKGVTEKEVASAKNLLLGRFPQAIETPEKLAFNLAILRNYGVSDSYLKDFQEHMDKISVSDVNTVIKKYFDEKNMKILVHAKATDVVSQLKPIGKVEVKRMREVN
jgi:zinc protease